MWPSGRIPNARDVRNLSPTHLYLYTTFHVLRRLPRPRDDKMDLTHSVKLHLRDERTNRRNEVPTDAGNRIWCFLAQNVTSGGNNLNNYPANQLTKFRLFIG